MTTCTRISVLRWFPLPHRHMPRAPLPASGVTSCAVVSRTPSVDVTPPSSLLWAHAPVQNPPADIGSPNPTGLCRLLQAPAGSWTFPTLSPQSLHGCLGPYPVAFLRCICPFLPGEHRPHLSGQRFGSLNSPCNATSTGPLFSGLQPFLYVQAPMLARPPGCTYRCNLPDYMAARPFTPRIEHVVAHHELWYRYMPESGNWHDGTFTRWIAALSAAPAAFNGCVLHEIPGASFLSISLLLFVGVRALAPRPCLCGEC